MSPRVKSGTLSLFIESHTLTELYNLGTSCAIRNFDHDMYSWLMLMNMADIPWDLLLDHEAKILMEIDPSQEVFNKNS